MNGSARRARADVDDRGDPEFLDSDDARFGVTRSSPYRRQCDVTR